MAVAARTRGTALRDEGIGSWIERRAQNQPGRPALVFGASSLTYSELADRVRRCANGLRQLGVGRGDRVAWLGPNHPAFVELLFASAKLGAVLSPTNHRLEPPAIARILEDSGPRVLVTHASVRHAVPPSGPWRHVVIDAGEQDAVDYQGLVSTSADDPIEEPVMLSDPCMLPFTSGTTGSPKGVLLTHGNVTWNVVNLLWSCDFRTDDVTVAIAPFFRVGGTGVNVLPVLFKGGTVVVPRAVDSDDMLRLIERHRVTIGFGNPDILDAMTRSASWPGADLTSVRFILTGGAPVPERLIRIYLERGVTFVQGYGLSEAAPFVLVLDPERAMAKVGSAGKPPAFVDVRIIRTDGSACEVDEVGELLARGPNVIAGYWNRPDATRRAIDDAGWLQTGDAARVDADGDVWIVDRVADRYIAGGGAVYPGHVERVLERHPSVVEAGVIGVAVAGEERGAAFVVVDADAAVDEAELIAFSRAHLKAHEIPASIRFLDSLPRSAVGKLDRARLRTLATS